ncbi:IclR family transcriptional regulator domain-containing protein [Muricoccus pecuniae]|uniref:IclR family pca regulon transcriptional regulator n=1 Tax=Muricoccus pecuniae TaxID=693023 RepID=A0A840Y6N0_9PROT|nr:IclR family transcriptional regulator C-terminal domain-containing protein [Roseomonas pecuniae]MBB5696395.1 IclR family pca regulon transcriptional regulator [Roseomonas pecuniae]
MGDTLHGRSEDGRKSELVTALARGLSVIEAFSADTPELTLSEVAQRTRLPPATARRALLTLQHLGYVGSYGKRFLLLPRVLGLGSAFLSSMNIREIAQSSLQAIADRFKDSASLAVLDGDSVLYVAHAPSNRRIRYNGSVGFRSPAYATSLGLALWAHLDPPQLEKRLAKAPYAAYTSRTRHTRAALEEAIASVRDRGYAVAREQLEYGVVAIAVPVRDTNGRVVAAINLSSELARNDEAALVATRLGPITDTAQEIERALERFPALSHAIGTAALAHD